MHKLKGAPFLYVPSRPKRFATACLLVLCCIASAAHGQNETLARGVAGLLQPFRTVNLSSSENGVLIAIPVVEGQVIHAGEVIAQLDSDLQVTQLKIARQRMVNQGELQVARAELEMRRQRLDKLLQIRREGHARQEEVERARTDLEMATARLLSQEEELVVRELEHLRAQQTLERRTIRSPIDGVISRLDRQIGELLSPVRPEVAVVIQADPILATFPVPIREVDSLQVGDSVPVSMDRGSKLIGEITSIGVTIDSASQTVQVKVQLDNSNRQLRVGEPCKLFKKNAWKAPANVPPSPVPPRNKPSDQPRQDPRRSKDAPPILPTTAKPSSRPSYPQTFAPPADFPTP